MNREDGNVKPNAMFDVIEHANYQPSITTETIDGLSSHIARSSMEQG